jgi:hypothetical protein
MYFPIEGEIIAIYWQNKYSAIPERPTPWTIKLYWPKNIL